MLRLTLYLYIVQCSLPAITSTMHNREYPRPVSCCSQASPKRAPVPDNSANHPPRLEATVPNAFPCASVGRTSPMYSISTLTCQLMQSIQCRQRTHPSWVEDMTRQGPEEARQVHLRTDILCFRPQPEQLLDLQPE